MGNVNTIRKNEMLGKFFTTHVILLFFIWMSIQFSIYLYFGISTDGEAKRFIEEANNLINGQPFSNQIYIMYLTEISLIYLKIKFFLSNFFIVFIQLILNGFALYRFYTFINETGHSKRSAFLGCLLLIACFPYQIYNSMIYTESIFFSMTILFSCFLLSIKKFHLKNLFLLIIFLTALCFTRPTGIFFAMASFLYVYIQLTKNHSLFFKTSLLLAITLPFLFILNWMMKSGKGVDVLLPFVQEHIICDIPTVNTRYIPNPENSPGLTDLIQYIAWHPFQFIQLGAWRTLAFFGVIRPYYSLLHNIYIALYFFAIYAAIVLGMIKRRFKIDGNNLYYLIVCGIFWLFVVFSCDEWHSRFFLTLTPFLILMGLHSLRELLEKNQR